MPPAAKHKTSRPRPGGERITRKRRGIGRPASGAESVGRDALIQRTCEMLRELPPNRITRAEVARHMHVDPSLIRYYFKDRSALLLAAAERLTSEFLRILDQEMERSDLSPEGQLAARAAAMLRLNVTYPFFHRLLLDEIVPMESPAATRFLNDLTQRAIGGYSAIIDAGVRDGTLRRVDCAFLFFAIIGMCEFFVTGMPFLRIARGKDADDRNVADRYREFIGELLLHGLQARSGTKT